jgi:hypothetical protein
VKLLRSLDEAAAFVDDVGFALLSRRTGHSGRLGGRRSLALAM